MTYSDEQKDVTITTAAEKPADPKPGAGDDDAAFVSLATSFGTMAVAIAMLNI